MNEGFYYLSILFMNKKIIFAVFVIVVVVGVLYFIGKSKNQLPDTGYHNTDGTIGTPEQEKLTEKTKEETNNKVVASSEKFYDFGKISMKDGNVTKVFKVTNDTDKDILYPSLTTSCMCTKAYFVNLDGDKKGPFGMPGMGVVPKLNQIIKAGSSADIEVVYDPNAHGPAGVGMIDRFVYLEDENGNKLEFEIKAIVTP